MVKMRYWTKMRIKCMNYIGNNALMDFKKH